MKSKILTDKKKRLLFKKNELKRLSIKVGNRLNTKLKLKNFIRLFNFPLNSSFTKIKDRCFVSGRAKAIFKKLKISRIKFREIATNGNLIGFTKSSW